MLDTADSIAVTPYQSGAKPGGLREWWKEHEAFLARFYLEPPLVDPLNPNKYKTLLSDAAFACRERGRNSIARGAPQVKDVFDDIFKLLPALLSFEALSVEQRENLFLKTVAGVLLDLEGMAGIIKHQLKLVPEVALSSICAGEGRGLVRLIQLINDSIDGVISSSICIPNEQFFRKFSLNPRPGNIPHSRANRAFQDEMVLLRHTMLLSLVTALLAKLGACRTGSDGPRIGSFDADFSKENTPFGIFPEKDEVIVPEVCGNCNKTAAGAGKPKLLRCGACWKVKRVEPYCSRECQIAAFPKHKAAGCGQKLSEFAAVPDFTTSLSKEKGGTKR